MTEALWGSPMIRRMQRTAYLAPCDFAALDPAAKKLCGRKLEWGFVGYFDGEPMWAHGEAVVHDRDLQDPDRYRPLPSVAGILLASFACWAAVVALLHFTFHLF